MKAGKSTKNGAGAGGNFRGNFWGNLRGVCRRTAACLAAVVAMLLAGCSSNVYLQARKRTSITEGMPDARQLDTLCRHRMTVGAGECYDLLLGVQCGGSDAFSGVASNPSIGYCVDLLVSGGVAVDIPAHAALVDGKRVDLPPKELAILRLLLEERGRVLRREDLLLRLWGWDYEGSDRVVDTHVKNLRRALGPWARCLKTVFKTGYKWEEE